MVTTLYDISVPLRPSMTTYPGDRGFERVEVKSLARGDRLTLSDLHMGSHSGTHVDAPSHFIPDGPTLDELPLETFIGPALVVDARGVEKALGPQDLPPRSRDKIVLFRTTNSDRWRRESVFFQDYVHLTSAAAEAVVESGVKTVGIDYLSVEGFGVADAPVHRTLLGHNLGIIEGLDLFAVPPGPYRLICLPLRVMGTEGAPARAILVRR